MRIKAEQFDVADADVAMARFESLLGKLVKVPKVRRGQTSSPRKPTKGRAKPRQKGLP